MSSSRSEKASSGSGQASFRSIQVLSGSNQASGSSQHGKYQNNTTIKNKTKRNAKVWYKLKEKNNSSSPLLRQPNEVLEVIFKHFFIGVHLTDVKTTQSGTVQRRYGAQSVLLVCKDLKEVTTDAMFKYGVFDIPHFKLHKKHRRENKMKTLLRIRHLDMLWTPPPAAAFTTKRGDNECVLQEIKHLQSLQVWLLASQYVRLENFERPELMSRIEVEEAMLAKFEPGVRSQPWWLIRLLRDAPKKFEGVDISLVGFFAFGPRRDEEDLTAAHISWPSRTIKCTDTIKWADWQRARAGLTCKHLRRVLAYTSLWDSSASAYGSSTARLGFARNIMRPTVGDHTFGRKVW